jgi:hypothetical protein
LGPDLGKILPFRLLFKAPGDFLGEIAAQKCENIWVSFSGAFFYIFTFKAVSKHGLL